MEKDDVTDRCRSLSATREAQHSPGPWRAAFPPDVYPRRGQEDELEICCLPHTTYDALDVFGPLLHRHLTLEEHEANARLIAAAPDTAAERDRLKEALRSLLTEVETLMAESSGVAGLHLNGDDAPWDELTEGGRFEGWLNLDRARAALTGKSE